MMNTETEALLQAIFEKIQSYHRILLFRHIRPDGDCVGATRGLQEILRRTWPDKEVFLQNCDRSEYMAFLGEEDELLDDSLYADALGIVLDTGTQKRISQQKYRLCREIIKIDHHLPVDSYGVLQWVEPERSSACEMMAAFAEHFRDRLQINTYAATCFFAGMVTDSGRFRYRSVSSETLRLAGTLLTYGVEPEPLYSHLYLNELSQYRFHAYVLRKAHCTKNGVLWIYVSQSLQKKMKLTREQASQAVSYIDSVKGSPIWLAFIENEDGTIRVRLRSRGIAINELASHYHGGGHEFACGSTVYSRSEVRKLVDEADTLLESYKHTHKDCL